MQVLALGTDLCVLGRVRGSCAAVQGDSRCRAHRSCGGRRRRRTVGRDRRRHRPEVRGGSIARTPAADHFLRETYGMPAMRYTLTLLAAFLILIGSGCTAPDTLGQGSGTGVWIGPTASARYGPYQGRDDDFWPAYPGYGRSFRHRPAVACDSFGRCWRLEPSDPFERLTSGDPTPARRAGRRISRDPLGCTIASCAPVRMWYAIGRAASATRTARSTKATRRACSASAPATAPTVCGTASAPGICSCRNGASRATASAGCAWRRAT